jgi:hypothetical protein
LSQFSVTVTAQVLEAIVQLPGPQGPAGGGGGGGAVDSVFGRTGVVVAVSGDYTSSLVTNASGVTGSTVTNALNTLGADNLAQDLAIAALDDVVNGPPIGALAGTTPAANKLPYYTSGSAAATTDLSAFGRTLIDDADAAAARSTLGLVIGTNVQGFDLELAAIAGAGSNTDRLFYYTSVGAGTLATLTAAGRALIDDADATAQRATLGLGALATEAAATAAQVDYREAMRFGWDGGGSAPTVNSGAQAMAEHGLVVKAASIVATDANGDRVSDSLTVQFAKVSSGGTVTVLGSVSLSAAGYVRDTTLSGWTTSIAEGDSVRGKITSAGTTAVRLSASLKCERV